MNNNSINNNNNKSTQRPRSNERRNKDCSVSFSNPHNNKTSSSNLIGWNSPLVDPNCPQIKKILCFFTHDNWWPPANSPQYNTIQPARFIHFSLRSTPANTIYFYPTSKNPSLSIPASNTDEELINKEHAEVSAFQTFYQNLLANSFPPLLVDFLR